MNNDIAATKRRVLFLLKTAFLATGIVFSSIALPTVPLKVGRHTLKLPDDAVHDFLLASDQGYEDAYKKIRRGLYAVAPTELPSTMLVSRSNFERTISYITVEKVRMYVVLVSPPWYVLPCTRNWILNRYYWEPRYCTVEGEEALVHQVPGPGNSVTVLVAYGPYDEIHSDEIESIISSIQPILHTNRYSTRHGSDDWQDPESGHSSIGCLGTVFGTISR